MAAASADPQEGRVGKALMAMFEKHRIVFWYDNREELTAEFEALALDNICKVELANNAFALKHRLLREAPKQRFLVYQRGAAPADTDNWLLDVQLANGEFRTDQVALWLAELELGLEFAPLAETHKAFFTDGKRRAALKKLAKPDDTRGQLKLKMLAVCVGSEARLDAVMEALLAELAEKGERRLGVVQRCGLDAFLWEQLERGMGYRSSEPGLRDFLLELFKSCFAMATDGEVRLSSDALVFLKRWKDSRKQESAFETLSNYCADSLNIEKRVENTDFRTLMELDYFRLLDMKVIGDLVRAVAARTVSAGDVALWVRQRRQGHWYSEFAHIYDAIESAALFFDALAGADLKVESIDDGLENYSNHWFRIDQLYRQFIWHSTEAKNSGLMAKLTDNVENLYSNNFLLPLNDRWQEHLDALPDWKNVAGRMQRHFFQQVVEPYLNKDKKLCVVISDALRYEIGEEFVGRIRREDRYDAMIEPGLSMLPSYTQLGMAALLPNTVLALSDNDKATVTVDGVSSVGTANRNKILRARMGDRGTAMKSDEFVELGRDDARALWRSNDVLYLYHNRIDHTGDKLQSEGKAFEAAEATLRDLLTLVKKLAAANVSNVVVTADHGFIYQHRELPESDFLSQDVQGDDIRYRDRRFVIGKGLKPSKSVRHFSSDQLGLAGELEVCIPNSINRLRLKGSGSRFVHGGASLQEVVIPIVRINKKRSSDLTQVDVDIQRGASNSITSNQLTVRMYQTGPVSDKVQPRLLRAGIYTADDKLISDEHELAFDLLAENARERELKVQFMLSRDADEADGKDVYLRLREKLSGTTHYSEYRSLRYTLRRSFTSDFDL